LRILAEITGKSLPPSTHLGREFVTIGSHAIHQGSTYDVFLGEYFTGERIAIKVLRHRVDAETAQKTHEVRMVAFKCRTILTPQRSGLPGKH
jgi:UDP-N-acetylmuramyl pentapeptide synthase